jgi:segregation and condensation protein B
LENPNLDNIVLALLFASDEPLSARKIAALIEDVTVADVKSAIDTWNARADVEAWSIGIEQVAGGYRLATRPDYATYVSRLYAGRRKFRLSRAGLETLAIVAYKQPITRAEIESIRGVGSGSVIANLMERSLVQITGKAKVLGAPFLYGTTQEFLEYLGLNSLRDLPSMEDLEALLAKEANAEAAVEGEMPMAARDDGAAEGEITAPKATADFDEEEDDDSPVALERALAHAASLGPRIDEPMNRPVTSGAAAGDADDDAGAEESGLTEDSDDAHR